MKTQTLKLVVQYDARWNEYTVFHHNLAPEVAEQRVRELSARVFLFFAVDQQGRHRAEDADHCEACHSDVERTSVVQAQTLTGKEETITAQTSMDTGQDRPHGK